MRPWLGIGLLLVAAGVGATQDAPAKKPPRPEKSPADAAAFAVELRTSYARPAKEWPKPTLDPGVEHREVGTLPAVEHPAANPHSKAKAELGKALFFDGRLSGSRQMACASCHDPDLAWADGRTVSFGHDRKALKRNSPSVQNAAFKSSFFWDGRAPSLEAQALAVLENPDEMRAETETLPARLKKVAGYPELFEAAFGDAAISTERIAQALACYQRTLVGGRSRFDAFLGGKAEALTDAEVRGLHVFRTEGRCLNCHNGPTFSDGKFHDVGLSYYGRELEDLGRFRVTKDKADVGAFRTPSLRNVGKTGPYMHNGLFDLDGVLRMYNAGTPTLRPREAQKDDPLFPTKSPLLKPLGLNKQDLADLEAFLRSLDEPLVRVRPPRISQPDGE